MRSSSAGDGLKSMLRSRKALFVIIFGLSMLVLTIYAGLVIISSLAQASSSARGTVAQNIVTGTLSIGAFALVFLGYSLVQKQEFPGTARATIHFRVAVIMYMLVPLSIVDALISVAYILSETSCMSSISIALFDTSIGLLFAIGIGLIAATTYVIAQELAY